jgi:hypothetical protein
MKFITDADEEVLVPAVGGVFHILEEDTFISAEAITVGDMCSRNVGATVDMREIVPSNSGQADGKAYCGVALTAAGAAGVKVRVLKRGMCEVSVLANAAKGATLYPTATNGALDDAPVGDQPLGVALELAGGAPELIYAWINAPF